MATDIKKRKIHKQRQEASTDDQTRVSNDDDQSESSMKKKSKTGDNRLDTLRNELSSLPLGELLSLKDHMPAKLFKKAIFNKRIEDSALNDDDTTDEVKTEEGEDEEIEVDEGTSYSAKRPIFKRDNRKRPREMSAKKPVSVLRDLFVTKKRVTRDPRFDKASGEFDPHLFRREYEFLDEIKKEEYKELRKEVKQQRDPEQLEKLRLLKQRIENQRRAEEDEEHKKNLKREVRKTNMGRLKDGKDPFYVKKSEIKRRLYDDKLERLEKQGKLKKHEVRREKKLAKKDRMPIA